MEVFLVGAIAATLRIATPLIFGTLGELFSERAGILNLGIEGTMFLGCFVGFVVIGFRFLLFAVVNILPRTRRRRIKNSLRRALAKASSLLSVERRGEG